MLVPFRSICAALLGIAPVFPQKLDVGSPAPALKIEKWLKGEAVDLASNKDRTIVVEFWATWCPPCRQSVPHLTELQKTFADQKVTIIGVTTADARNSLRAVESFVRDQGNKMNYTVALDKGGATYAAYMEAAQLEAIPMAFVIDKTNTVVWIGHPLDGLDKVLRKIVKGTYDPETRKKWRDAESELDRAGEKQDWDGVIAAGDKLTVIDPTDSKGWMVKLYAAWLQQKKPKEGDAIGEQALRALANESRALREMVGYLCSAKLRDSGADLALKMLDRMVALDPEDASNYQIRFDILRTIKADQNGAQQAAETAIKKSRDAGALGAFAWALLTEEDTKGKWNALALAAAQKCAQLPGGDHFSVLDTIALAKFENGDVVDAVELQRNALEKCDDYRARPELQARLERFEKARQEKRK